MRQSLLGLWWCLAGSIAPATAVPLGCDVAVNAENYEQNYRYFWAEVGIESQMQGVIAPTVAPSCSTTVPCTSTAMYPGGTAHSYGWIAPVKLDSLSTFMFFAFGGEGVSQNGASNVLLRDLWGFSGGQWYIFGGQSMASSEWPQARAGLAGWFNDSPDAPATYIFGGWSSATEGGTQCNMADLWVLNTTQASFDSVTSSGIPVTAKKLSPAGVSTSCDFEGSRSWPAARTEASTWKSKHGNDTLLWLAFGRRAGPSVFVETRTALNDVWYFNVSSNTWTEVQAHDPNVTAAHQRPPVRSSASLWAVNTTSGAAANGTTLQGRAAEVWVFGGLNSSDVNCMMDDFWHASVTFNSSTGNFTLHWEEVKVPSTSNRPSARGIAQSWLQYEHVNDFTDGNWVHFEKTTLWLMGGFELVATPGSSGTEEQALGDLWYWDLFYSKWVLVHNTAAYETPASSSSYLSCQLSDSFVVGPRWGATTWYVDTNPNAIGDDGRALSTYPDILGATCLTDMNRSLEAVQHVEFCNSSTNFDPSGTVLVFGGKGLINSKSQQNEFLNQFYFAQLVHAPEFPLFLEVGLGVVAAVVVAGLVVVAVHFARRRVRTSKSVKSDSMADPLLAVRTASGARVLDKEYKKRLLIPFGRLTLNEFIARGASGQIFRGTLDGSPVAVKELVSVMFDPEQLNEFVNEAASLAALRHPHIVGFYGISKKEETENQKPRLWLVMELCDTSFHEVMMAVDKQHRLLAPPPPSPGGLAAGPSPAGGALLSPESQIASAKMPHHPEFFFGNIDVHISSGRRTSSIGSFKSRLMAQPGITLRVDRLVKTTIAFQAASAIGFMHAKNLFHRDLKPANILLQFDGNQVGSAKICDFGLSKLVSPGEESSVMLTQSVGTPAFMAPELMNTTHHSDRRDGSTDEDGELARGRPSRTDTSESFDTFNFAKKEYSFHDCAQMDIYSFGVVLWSVCTLKLPYRGLSPMKCLQMVAVGGRPSLRELREYGGSWGADMANIIRDCWKQDPKQRPSIDQVAQRLQQVGLRLGQEFEAAASDRDVEKATSVSVGAPYTPVQTKAVSRARTVGHDDDPTTTTTTTTTEHDAVTTSTHEDSSGVLPGV